MSKHLTYKPLQGTIADQPPLVQVMIREGVRRALAVAPARVTLQREERDMGAKRWTKDEEAEIQKLAGEGLSPYAISLRVDRAESAIEDRLKLLQRGKPVSAEFAAEFVAKAVAEAVELKAPATSQPAARSVTPLAALILAAAMEHARLGGIALHCQDVDVSLPKEVAAWFNNYRPEPGSDAAEEMDEHDPAPGLTLLVRHGWVAQPVVEGGRQVGWKIDLPTEHSDGLRSVQVRVA
jgi:hypothetical protein